MLHLQLVVSNVLREVIGGARLPAAMPVTPGVAPGKDVAGLISRWLAGRNRNATQKRRP